MQFAGSHLFETRVSSLVLGVFLVCTAYPNRTQAQFVTQDWKLHDVGQVRQLITNRGILNKLGTNYPGLINSEYPPNSFVEHMGGVGFYIGAVTPAGDTLVTVTKSWGSSDEMLGYSAEPWDTIWVNTGTTGHEIPYAVPYPGGTRYAPGVDTGYVALSDQDFVTRYNDYNAASRTIASHEPMYIDVIQTSYAWSSPPLDEIIVINYSITPTQHALLDLYVANFVDGNVGLRTGAEFAFASDDYATYRHDLKMGITHDADGGLDGGKFSPMGIMVIPSSEKPAEELTWTWIWGDTPPSMDPARYRHMSSGTIMQDQLVPGQTNYILGWGPYERLDVGDTLHFSLAIVMGRDEDALIENAHIVNWLVSRNFQVPKPPPVPPARAEASSHEVTLRWDPQAGDVNPETYEDPNRADGAEQPFEGYRIYKSTNSATGPWTLLAEFDVPGNEFGQNAGLAYEYTDTGLLNNIEYYYAVTAFSKEDKVANFPSQETSRNANALTVVPGTPTPETVGEVAVVPNPYRGDINYNSYNPPWEKPPPTRERWLEQDRRLQFINLPSRCRIDIYTLSGTLVETLHHDDPIHGYEDWNLTSRVGQAISSGVYLFTVEDLETGRMQVGKFVVIK